jgi:flavin-dependent dehydrogenase
MSTGSRRGAVLSERRSTHAAAQKMTTWDIVVVGAGPAGAATAATLAKYGWRVLLVERRLSASFTLGETLPPSSIGLVEHFLGDPEAQGFPGHLRTVGNLSVWAGEHVELAEFFFSSTGFGLCIDRVAFDEALRSKAVADGAALFKGSRFESCEFDTDQADGWRVTLASGKGRQHHRARYLVDCSGRTAVVAKTLGVETIHHDGLFAYAQWFSCVGEDDDRYTRIEAAPQGWWYSSRLPSSKANESRRLVVFHTDMDLPAARTATSPAGFNRLLHDSNLIASLLKSRGYRARGAIRGAPAGGQRLTEFCGDAWMAVGDAAQAYDPLSSRGIDKALRTADYAAHMIHYALSDCSQGPSALDRRNEYVSRYEEGQRQLWRAYVSQRKYYYGVQPRWSEQPFWRRRRHPRPARP